jgi:hypothetical protein
MKLKSIYPEKSIYHRAHGENFKWIASDIPRGLATGLASEYNKKNIPCIEIPCGLAGGSLQYKKVTTKLLLSPSLCPLW